MKLYRKFNLQQGNHKYLIIMNRLSRQEQIRIFRYLFPVAIVLSLLLYGIFGSKVIWNAVLYLAIATFILRMIRMWLEFKEEKKDQKKGM